MRTKLAILLTGSFLLMIMLGTYIVPISPPADKYDLIVMKIYDEWRVVDASDHTKSKVKVKKGDRIVWTAEGTNAYFQFPAPLFECAEDSLDNGYTAFVKDGKKLNCKVKDDAQSGIYEYAVFCTAGGVFAKGDSPPKIVIE